MSTVVGQSRMVRVWGATDGELLAALFVANRKKRNATKHKTNAPFAITPPPNVPKRSLGRIPGHAPLAVSFHFHPPFIPRKPTPCLISRPLLPTPSPPPSGLLRNRTRKEASVFHLGEEAAVSHLDGPAVRLAGKRHRRQIQEQRRFPPQKKDPYMISLLIRGEDDQGIDLAIRFPCDLAESGFFFFPITKFGEYNVLPDWHKVTFAE